MLEKMFTTKMGMDKKKLQNRFSKIRSKNGKTSKFIALAVFAVIIVSIICVSIWVAVNKQDDKKDVVFADEYERMSKGITHIESTFSLINDIDTPVITNAENMSYAQMKDLQRQVDNGHFPWRLDYEQVMQSYISGKGYGVEDGSMVKSELFHVMIEQ